MVEEGVAEVSVKLADGLFHWQTLLPLIIFIAEMLVVTLATIRIIFVARGKRMLAAVLGFFEISIWLFAIGHVMSNLSNPWCTIAFAAGFTLGNYLGITLEGKLAIGTLGVSIFARGDAEPLLKMLREHGFGATRVQAEGSTGPVQVVTTIIPRRERARVERLIARVAPGQFFVVDEVQDTVRGIFPAAGFRHHRGYSHPEHAASEKHKVVA
ncbi:MAG: DUF5698 domain-containing protein [Gemmataceae bacterium]|jgi:uncharacterized protein YebE (UPF0316 family)|nr:DUF5698 domain-containing protein [Gemmataceae bacterium]